MKRKRIKRKSKSGIIYLLLFALLVVGAVFFLNSEFFTIKSISVEGAYSVSNEVVLETSGIKEGENLFDFKAKTAENLIKTIPVVKNVSVVRQYPDKVKIIITQRVPFVTIYTGNLYYSLDDEGMVLSETEKINDSDSIVLSGVSDVQPVVSQVYDINSNVNILTAYELSSWLRSQNLLNRVSEVHVSAGGYYYMYTKNSNVIKFYSLSSFKSKEDFIKDFIQNEKRSIMVEVVEDSEPVYKVININ